MTEKISLTALVTGIPPFVHGPELRKGEDKIHFLVRHQPDQWNNMIEYLKNDLKVSEHNCSLLRSLQLDEIKDPVIESKIEGWANWRLPTHSRTLMSLNELRERIQEEENNPKFADMTPFRLEQILWPREKNPFGDTSAEKWAADMGAEVIPLEAGRARELDLSVFLPRIKGTYLWILPGGSKFMRSLVMSSLRRVLLYMDGDPRTGMYFDGSYSFICRVSALRQAAGIDGTLPANFGYLAGALKEAGFLFSQDTDRDSQLCEIEKIYGGDYPFPRPDRSGWLRRLFGG